jgi:hypothetical protein
VIRLPINEAAWQAAGVPTIVEDARVRVRLVGDGGEQTWIDLARDGGDVVLFPERSSSHRKVAQALGRL